MDHETQTEVSHFGDKHRFPCAYVEGDTVYVIATKETHGWCGDTLTVFTSKDLLHWTLRPEECNRRLGGTAISPHCLRYADGWYYLFSTVGGYPTGWVLLLDRSRDLKTWEPSPFNPMMVPQQEDRLIANQKLTADQRNRIANAADRNNSDIDFCESNGQLIINYSWGNQHGIEHIAEAEFAGTEAQFLTGWFPDMSVWAGVDLSQPPSTFLKHREDYGRVLSANGATVTISSGDTNNLAQLLGGTCARPFAFHTGGEQNPWVTIDLGREASLAGILIRNRTDCCQERAENLRVQISHDGRQWREIWKARSSEPGWEIPLRGQDIKARYLRLDTQPATPTPFHLHHVEVWGTE